MKSKFFKWNGGLKRLLAKKKMEIQLSYMTYGLNVEKLFVKKYLAQKICIISKKLWDNIDTNIYVLKLKLNMRLSLMIILLYFFSLLVL